jgi:hypothetical protein
MFSLSVMAAPFVVGLVLVAVPLTLLLPLSHDGQVQPMS